MMGILGDVAYALNVDIQQAGHFIAAYSAGVAVGAPLLIVLRRVPLQRLMLLLAATVFLGNLGAALSVNYGMLLGARFVSGLPHGCFFGAGAIVCARLVDPGKGAVAVAVMVGGMTIANVVGVPLATFLSNLLNWRALFIVVAAFALSGVLTIKFWVPAMAPLPDTGIKGQFSFLRRKEPWLIYGGVFFGQASVYCYLSYIDPIMTKLANFSAADMSWIMMIAGLGMVIGNAAAGKLASRFGEARVSASITFALIFIMPAVFLCASYKLPSIVLMFLATAGLFGIGGPLQYLIVRYAKGGEMLGGAGIQIAFNVSNAVSAALGGGVIHQGFGLAAPALLGTPFAIIGFIALAILVTVEKKCYTAP